MVKLQCGLNCGFITSHVFLGNPLEKFLLLFWLWRQRHFTHNINNVLKFTLWWYMRHCGGRELRTVPAVGDKWLHSITAPSITAAQMSVFTAFHGRKWQNANVISIKNSQSLHYMGINYVGNLNDPHLKQILPEPALINSFIVDQVEVEISWSSRVQVENISFCTC